MEYANRTVKMDTFCFYGNGDHRDLHVLTHSFPTRRTSDLRRGGRCRRAGTRDVRPCPMIPLPPTTRIYLACGATDMRKGFDGLAVLVQQVLEKSPHSGALFAFRGKRGDLVKLL